MSDFQKKICCLIELYQVDELQRAAVALQKEAHESEKRAEAFHNQVPHIFSDLSSSSSLISTLSSLIHIFISNILFLISATLFSIISALPSLLFPSLRSHALLSLLYLLPHLQSLVSPYLSHHFLLSYFSLSSQVCERERDLDTCHRQIASLRSGMSCAQSIRWSRVIRFFSLETRNNIRVGGVSAIFLGEEKVILLIYCVLEPHPTYLPLPTSPQSVIRCRSHCRPRSLIGRTPTIRFALRWVHRLL